MHRSAPAAVVDGGFSNPVFDAQSVFRGLMDAMAAPGRIVDLGGLAAGPAPLDEGVGSILAALSDYDTPVFIEAPDQADAAAWLAFQTAAPVTRDPGHAAFAVLSPGSDVAGWSRFSTGTASYPDRSATLLLPVDSLTGGPDLHLTGPGIDGQATLAAVGLPRGFVTARAANAALFPLGLDLILVAGRTIAALPRTTRVTALPGTSSVVEG